MFFRLFAPPGFCNVSGNSANSGKKKKKKGKTQQEILAHAVQTRVLAEDLSSVLAR